MPKLVRLGVLAFDEARACLMGPAGPSPCGARASTSCVISLSEPGGLSPRKSLIKAIWPDVTVGDEFAGEVHQRGSPRDRRRGQSVIKTVPRRGYLFDAPIAPADIPASGATADAIIPDRPSIAVLPFANIERRSAAGVLLATASLRTSSRSCRGSAGLFVIARNSSFQWKGKIDRRTAGWARSRRSLPA